MLCLVFCDLVSLVLVCVFGLVLGLLLRLVLMLCCRFGFVLIVGLVVWWSCLVRLL